MDGVRTVGHGGSANGQFAELLTVPERDFAVVALANAGPDGIPCNQAVVRWALQTYLGVVPGSRTAPLRRDAGPGDRRKVQDRCPDAHHPYEWGKANARGRDQTGDPCGGGQGATPDYAPADIGLLPGNGDEYVVTSGGLNGQRGFFTRDGSGAVVGVDLAGRLFSRVPAASE